MTFEVGLVFDRQGRTIHWFGGHSPGFIPDSRSLWDVLWENRDRLGGVGHTHPRDGPATPSHTHLTTFDAVERALGKQLLWLLVPSTKTPYVLRTPLFDRGTADHNKWTKA